MLCKNGNSISVIQWVWDYPQNIKTERFGSQSERSVFPVWVLTGFLAALQENPGQPTPFFASVTTLAVLALPLIIALTRTFVLVIIGMRD